MEEPRKETRVEILPFGMVRFSAVIRSPAAQPPGEEPPKLHDSTTAPVRMLPATSATVALEAKLA
jgi:hypothetical protein